MPIAPLSRSEIEEKLRHENLDEWQKLWWASQGDDLAFADWTLMAAAVPFPETQALSVLDLCCGPGDAGRFMHRRFHQATVDRLDRDSFFLALPGALNRRSRVPGESYSRDLWDPRWRDGLPRDYHVAVVTASLHWLDVLRLGEILGDVLGLLRPGGVFLFAEPACPDAKFAQALANWKPSESDTYDPAAWDRFWERANAMLGYDHTAFLGHRPNGKEEIGDRGIPVLQYSALLRGAGFESIDVLRRKSEYVVMAAAKPSSAFWVMKKSRRCNPRKGLRVIARSE